LVASKPLFAGSNVILAPTVGSIDLDQGHKRRVVGVVGDEKDPMVRVVSQLIGPQGVRSASEDIAAGDNLAGPEVDGDHPAVGVGHKKPMSTHHDAVGTGSAVVRRALHRVKGDSREPSRDRLHEHIGSRVENVDALVGAVGDIEELGVRVEPADVPAVEGLESRSPG
jgi:hypothetical protein